MNAILRSLSISTLVLLAPAALAVQNPDSPDQDVAAQFLSPGSTAGDFDMAYAPDGPLVVALVERNPLQDKLIVATRDASGTWKKLSKSNYMYDDIKEISLDIPRAPTGDTWTNRVFVACVFSSVDPSMPAGFNEILAIVSGPYAESWVGPGLVAPVWNLGFPKTDSLARWRPGVACVPVNRSDWSNYVVELVFMWPNTPGSMDGLIYRTRSEDYGRNVLEATELAGPNSPATGTGSMDLKGIRYGNPFVVGDDQNALTVYALEDRANEVVHVLASSPKSGALSMAATTAKNDHRREHLPVLAADEGRVNMTCLTGERMPDGGFGLVWWFGNAFTWGSFSELGSLHGRADSPADILIREDDASITARVFLDSHATATATVAWQGHRRALLAPPVMHVVSDSGATLGNPHVALTLNGDSPAFESYAFRSIMPNKAAALMLDL